MTAKTKPVAKATTTTIKTTTTKKAGTKSPAAPKKEVNMDKNMNKPVVTETASGAVKVYEKDFVQAAQKHDKAIKAGFGKASKCFFEIATHLYWIYENDAYKTFGADNINDFALDRYDIGKSTVSNYIAIVRRFCRPALESDLYVLKDAYSAYSPSQLAQMLPYTDDQIGAASIDPKMSCRAIKKALAAMLPDKSAPAPDKSATASAETGSTAHNDASPETAPEPEPSEPAKTIMIVIRGADDYRKKEERMLELIHNLLSKKPGARLEIGFVDEPAKPQ